MTTEFFINISKQEIKATKHGTLCLRFSLTWGFRNEETVLSATHGGCYLAITDRDEAVWSYARTYVGGRNITIHNPSPDLYKAVMEALVNTGEVTRLREAITALRREEEINLLDTKKRQTALALDRLNAKDYRRVIVQD